MRVVLEILVNSDDKVTTDHKVTVEISRLNQIICNFGKTLSFNSSYLFQFIKEHRSNYVKSYYYSFWM